MSELPSSNLPAYNKGAPRLQSHNRPLSHFVVAAANDQWLLTAGMKLSARLTGKQAVIFDMDGVLVDSEPLHDGSFQRVAAEIGHADHGLHFPDYLGRSDKVLWQDFLSRHQSPHRLEDLIARKAEVFLKAIRRRVPIYPGLYKLLRDLQPRYRLALVSGSSRQVVDAVVSGAGIESFFAVRVSADDVKNCKPDPEGFLKAARFLHIVPRQCVVIEDSAGGVEAAHRAGMVAVAITNSLPRSKLSRADYIVTSYGQIRLLLLASNPGGPLRRKKKTTL
jgi:HAD superfamily hydrolase (TIGR01509 family)